MNKVKKLEILSNFISNTESQQIIQLIEDYPQWLGPQRKMLLSIKDGDLKSLLLKYLNQIQNHTGNHSLFIQEYAPGVYLPGFSMGLHTDVEDRKSFVLSAVAYLNESYVGGEIEFPNLKFIYRPKAGDLMLFPSGGEDYDHQVNVLKSGKRYLMTIWMTHDASKADPFIHEKISIE